MEQPEFTAVADAERARQMCDSIADYYGRIIGCSVKVQPPRPTLNPFAGQQFCRCGVTGQSLFFAGGGSFDSSSAIVILSAQANRCRRGAIIPCRRHRGRRLGFHAQLGLRWPPRWVCFGRDASTCRAASIPSPRRSIYQVSRERNELIRDEQNTASKQN